MWNLLTADGLVWRSVSSLSSKSLSVSDYKTMPIKVDLIEDVSHVLQDRLITAEACCKLFPVCHSQALSLLPPVYSLRCPVKAKCLMFWILFISIFFLAKHWKEWKHSVPKESNISCCQKFLCTHGLGCHDTLGLLLISLKCYFSRMYWLYSLYY